MRSEHFGFICRENANGLQTFMGYIFKCESASIASDAVAGKNIFHLSITKKVKKKYLKKRCLYTYFFLEIIRGFEKIVIYFLIQKFLIIV